MSQPKQLSFEIKRKTLRSELEATNRERDLLHDPTYQAYKLTGFRFLLKLVQTESITFPDAPEVEPLKALWENRHADTLTLWHQYLDLDVELTRYWNAAYEQANATLVPPEQLDGRLLTPAQRALLNDPNAPSPASDKTSKSA